MENWQSEYLQFTLFILATVWLVQKGSPESKPLGQEGGESAFLSEGTDGWKLSAVGCKPEKGRPHNRPYECEAES